MKAYALRYSGNLRLPNGQVQFNFGAAVLFETSGDERVAQAMAAEYVYEKFPRGVWYGQTWLLEETATIEGVVTVVGGGEFVSVGYAAAEQRLAPLHAGYERLRELVKDAAEGFQDEGYNGTAKALLKGLTAVDESL